MMLCLSGSELVCVLLFCFAGYEVGLCMVGFICI